MASPRPSRVNLRTLADRLGISVSTASRALRSIDGVHEETRRQVVELARSLGYPVESDSPPAGAGNAPPRLLMSLSQCALPNVDQSYMAGMSAAAVSCNASILTHLVNGDQCHSVLEPSLAPPALRSGLVQGLVLLHRWPVEVATELCGRVPVVSVVHEYPGLPIDHIGVDDRGGVDAVIRHFQAGGHEKVGFFGLCREVTWSRSRYGAYVEALMARDLPLVPANVINIDLTSALATEDFPSAPWAAQLRARLNAGVDAWFCPSAMTGQTLLRHALKEGWKVPGDLALASFHGGSFPHPRDLPAITTTHVIDEELGATAVRRLVTRLENPGDSRRSILLPARFAAGATTRPI